MWNLFQQLPRFFLLSSVMVAFNPLPIAATTLNLDQKTDNLNLVEVSQLPSEPEIGFEVVGSQRLNYVVIPIYQYVGECPGRGIGSREAMFTNSEITPTSGLRVVVRNVSRGMSSDPFPYTDRKYERGRSSESTEITFGYEHRGSYFVGLEGINTYEYEIRNKNTVIDRGTFNAELTSQTRVIERNKREVTERYCAKKDVPLYKCKKDDIRERTVMKCDY